MSVLILRILFRSAVGHGPVLRADQRAHRPLNDQGAPRRRGVQRLARCGGSLPADVPELLPVQRSDAEPLWPAVHCTPPPPRSIRRVTSVPVTGRRHHYQIRRGTKKGPYGHPHGPKTLWGCFWDALATSVGPTHPPKKLFETFPNPVKRLRKLLEP